MSGPNLLIVGKNSQRICRECRNMRARNFNNDIPTERANYSHCPHGHAFTKFNTITKHVHGKDKRYCRECEAASAKKRYDANPEKFRRNTREWRARNIERAARSAKASRMEPGFNEVRRIKDAIYRENNRERIRAGMRRLYHARGRTYQAIVRNGKVCVEQLADRYVTQLLVGHGWDRDTVKSNPTLIEVQRQIVRIKREANEQAPKS